MIRSMSLNVYPVDMLHNKCKKRVGIAMRRRKRRICGPRLALGQPCKLRFSALCCPPQMASLLGSCWSLLAMLLICCSPSLACLLRLPFRQLGSSQHSIHQDNATRKPCVSSSSLPCACRPSCLHLFSRILLLGSFNSSSALRDGCLLDDLQV